MTRPGTVTDGLAASQLLDRTLRSLERSLVCDLIASPIDFGGGVKPRTSQPEEIVAYALENRYSRVPLCGHGDDGGQIVEVARVDLRSGTLVGVDPADDYRVLAADTPIGVAIPILSKRRYLLLSASSRITKILTVSDVNKLPARVYLYTICCHWEGLLADLIASNVQELDWLAMLTDGQRALILRRQRRKQRADLDTRLIDVAGYGEKVRIVSQSSACWNLLASTGRGYSEAQAERVGELRNAVAHGRSPFASWRGFKDIAAAVSDMEAWIDEFGKE